MKKSNLFIPIIVWLIGIIILIYSLIFTFINIHKYYELKSMCKYAKNNYEHIIGTVKDISYNRGSSIGKYSYTIEYTEKNGKLAEFGFNTDKYGEYREKDNIDIYFGDSNDKSYFFTASNHDIYTIL